MSIHSRVHQVLRNNTRESEEGGSTAGFRLPEGLARYYGLDGRAAPVSRPGDAAEQRADDAADRAMTSGRPLAGDAGDAAPPPAMRERLQPHVGADLSRVRFHTGNESVQAAQALHARAFTIGNDIHFGAGQYRPGSPDGDRLIAHEMAHTGGDGVVYRMKLQVGDKTFATPTDAEQWKEINIALYESREKLEELIEISLTLQQALKDGDYHDEKSLNKAINNVAKYIVELGGEVPNPDGEKEEKQPKQKIVHERGRYTKAKPAPRRRRQVRTEATSSQIFAWLHGQIGCGIPTDTTAAVWDRDDVVTLKNTRTQDEKPCGVHLTFFAPANEQNVQLDHIQTFFRNQPVGVHVTIEWYPPGDAHANQNPRAFKSNEWTLDFPHTTIGNRDQKKVARGVVRSLREEFEGLLTRCAQALRNA